MLGGVEPPSKRCSTSGRRLPEALLMMWRSFLSSPWTSLTTWTVPLGSVRIASRFASISDATSAVQPVWCEAPRPAPLSPWKYS